MQPAFSVVFLTTLIGAGQGLFLALYAASLLAAPALAGPAGARLVAVGAAVAIALAALGLVASFFHLGHPERAWRTATKWRTSWLSREVIALPTFIGAVAAWAGARWLGLPYAGLLGVAALAACLALFVCTAMIYACIKFLQEWASPFTMANFVLIGCASGLSIAAALAAFLEPELAAPMATAALVLTVAAFASRLASLKRNRRLRPRSTAQSAIGFRGNVVQKSQGFTGSSFNTREFFHGLAVGHMRAIRRGFLALAFVVPALLLAAGLATGSVFLLAAAPAVQYAGIIAERWYFLADSNHPQNLYYQCAS